MSAPNRPAHERTMDRERIMDELIATVRAQRDVEWMIVLEHCMMMTEEEIAAVAVSVQNGTAYKVGPGARR